MRPLSSGVALRGGGEVQESNGVQRSAGQRQSQPHLSGGHTKGRHRGDGGADVGNEKGAGRQVKGEAALVTMQKRKKVPSFSFGFVPSKGFIFLLVVSGTGKAETHVYGPAAQARRAERGTSPER